MDNNSPYEALPSYWKNSKRELNKAHSRADSTFANIRKRLNKAILSVPYEKGLESLHILQKNGHHRLSPIEKEAFHSGYHSYDSYARMPRTKPVSEHGTPRSITLGPVKSRGKSQDVPRAGRSPDTVSLPLKPSKARSDRIGSETSTVSTKSRPFSFSNSEYDESFWMNNLKHIEELKEKYSADSEFVASIHGFRYQKEMEAKKKETDRIKTEEMNRIKMEKVKIAKKPKSHESSFSNEKVLNFLEGRSPEGRRNTPEGKGRLTLPPLNNVIEDDKRSEGSGWTLPSNTESTSSNKSKKSNKDYSKAKRRKVEFNLFPKKKLVLPPLTSRDDDRHPIKSILKKDSMNYLPPGSVSSQGGSEAQPGDREAGYKTSWEEHLPRLRSPVPASAARRDPVVFAGNSRGFYFKCSKEFETVLGNFDID